MSYQVLARKWRPRAFSELVGQEVVVRALTNALDQQRLHHAYLFTGTRGVGKTTIGRILAKALNCEEGVGSHPCGKCPSCQEIEQGRFADLLEVDAASRTKVDQTRELLENVPYAPVRGRYKVYLIDEVHMFSEASFNALLKTLEEPPPHVKFLLATTDPQKLPVTVLSRCLQFHLRRLEGDEIRGQFERILQTEAVAAEPEALAMLARAADGSMRDGLSLLDQAISLGGGSVRTGEVRDMLGLRGLEALPELLLAVQAGDGGRVLQLIADLAERTPDFARVLQELAALLHRIALLQAVPDLTDPNRGDLELARQLAQTFAAEDVQLYYQMALHGLRDLTLAPDARGGVEMTLIRMLAFRPDDRLGGSAGAAGGTGRSRREQASAPTSAAESAAVQTVSRAAPAAPTKPPAPVDLAEGELDWHALLERLRLKGIAAQLASHCVLQDRQGDEIRLSLDPACATLASATVSERLRGALSDYFGRPIRLQIAVGELATETPARRAARNQKERSAAAIQQMRDDPLVQALGDEFDAELDEGSVKPIG